MMLEKIVKGGIAGIFGGIVFGLWLADKGMLPGIARLVGGSSPALGFGVQLAFSAIIGAGFGLIFDRRAEGPTSGLLWGMVYGFVWWFLGPLTLMPLWIGMGVQWTAASVSAMVPSLIWQVVFGGIMGVAYIAMSGDMARRSSARL